MHGRRCFQLLAIIAILASTSPPAQSSILRAMDLAELTRSADQIVVGDVLSVNAAWDREHRSIYSTVEIGIQESWKGAPSSSGKMVVRHIGGTVGEIEMTVQGEVRFAQGERAVLFLNHARTVGMAQGKRQLRWEVSARRWLVAAPDRRGATLVPGVKGTPVTDIDGKEETLESLRARVQALLGK